MSLSSAFWMAKACWKGNRKQNPRDKVVIEEDEVRYILWQSQIATWDRKQNTLRVDDCNWKTPLTFSRLNAILSKLHVSLYNLHGTHFICGKNQKTDYRWEGQHTINLSEPIAINPHTPRKFNPKVSKALNKYYALALNLVCKRKLLITQTAHGIVCLFPRQICNGRFLMPILGLSMLDSENLRVHLGKVTCSKVYSAFMKNDATPLGSYLATSGVEICDSEVIGELDSFGVDVSCLPSEVQQQLALLKLVEA